MREIKLATIDPEVVEKEIGDFLIKEILEEGRTGGAIGLSGGVDSTTVAALAKRAFDRYNLHSKDKLELVGYMLPSKLNHVSDEEDGEKVAKRIGIRYEKVNIESLVESLRTTNPEVFQNTGKGIYDKGNAISRLRAVVINTKASSENKIVLGTGNRDEDFVLGFYTLFGDGAVRVSPIAMLPKRLVREMAGYLGFKDLAYRVSSPGLEPGQTSFGTLGYNYETAEIVVEGIEQKFSLEELAKHPQVVKAVEADVKEYETNFGYKKFKNPDEVISDIVRRKEIAAGKSRILHPPVAEITLKYGSKR